MIGMNSLRNAYRSKSMLLNLMAMVHIQCLKTPNPNFLKFVPQGVVVMGEQGTLDIPSRKYADVSPLAVQLFGITGIERVFYGKDYISVAKSQQKEWDIIKPQIYTVLSHFFQNKLNRVLSMEAGSSQSQAQENASEDSEVVQLIKQIIESRIRPSVQEDGGDVKYVSFDQKSGVLTLRMEGACSGCPSSSATLKGGIQKMLTYYVKEVTEVIAE